MCPSPGKCYCRSFMKWSRLAIPLLLALPFLVELQVSAVWDSNEAFYVQTPREMRERGRLAGALLQWSAEAQ